MTRFPKHSLAAFALLAGCAAPTAAPDGAETFQPVSGAAWRLESALVAAAGATPTVGVDDAVLFEVEAPGAVPAAGDSGTVDTEAFAFEVSAERQEAVAFFGTGEGEVEVQDAAGKPVAQIFEAPTGQTTTVAFAPGRYTMIVKPRGAQQGGKLGVATLQADGVTYREFVWESATTGEVDRLSGKKPRVIRSGKRGT